MHPTGDGDGVEVLWWGHRDKREPVGGFGGVILSWDEELEDVAEGQFLGLNAWGRCRQMKAAQHVAAADPAIEAVIEVGLAVARLWFAGGAAAPVAGRLNSGPLGGAGGVLLAEFLGKQLLVCGWLI